jgi:hypothetical protein
VIGANVPAEATRPELRDGRHPVADPGHLLVLAAAVRGEAADQA